MISFEGQQFQTFCAKYLRFTLGPDAGRPFLLEPWQVEFASEALRKDNGTRVYQQALLGVARGNGKSTFSSALALYALVVEGALYEQASHVYALAASMEQARIVFDEAKRMVQASPLLVDYVKVYRNTLYIPDTGAIFRVLPAGYPEKLHGLSPSFFIADELHAWKDPELWYAMATAQGKRPNSLGIAITTAGFDLNTICGDLYSRGKNQEDGFYFKWYEVADEDVENVDKWFDANPASFVTKEFLLRQKNRLPISTFYRLHLNRWTRTEKQWLPVGSWDECVSDLRIEEGDEVWLGVDLGVSHDTAAIVEVAQKDGKYVVRSHVIAAHPDASKAAPASHYQYEGSRVPIAMVENKIREIAEHQIVKEIVYDPWRFARSAELLEGDGFLTVEYPMTNYRLAPASQRLFDEVVARHVAHDGDEVLAAHIAGCVAKETDRGWRIVKSKETTNPNDAALALLIALDRAMAGETNAPAVYVMSI